MIYLEVVFWASVLSLLFVYVGYPLVLALLRLGCADSRKAERSSPLPRVSVIISAYNESPVIGAKLRNTTELEYPHDRLQIIVVSDASTDGTDDVVTGFGDPRVQLLRMHTQSGKSAGLNEAVQQANGEILVFTDANAMFKPDALRKIVTHFSSPEVGCVTGRQAYHPSDDPSAHSEGLYWRYEVFIKKAESSIGSLVGGDGAIMAIRRDLFTPLAPEDLSDYLVPLRIAAAGYRNVYEHEAVCFEHGAEGFDREFRRKVRIVNRAWRATWKAAPLLLRPRNALLAFQVLSHKLLRWLAPVFMLTALVANVVIVLAIPSPLYWATLVLQVVFYGLAILGWLEHRLRDRVPRLLAIPLYFCMVNIASAKGVIDAMRGETYTTWNTVRDAESSPSC